MAVASLIAVPAVALTAGFRQRQASLLTAPRRVSAPGRLALVRASTEDSNGAVPAAAPTTVLQTPSDFGLGGSGAWFGFGPRQELNVGRLAMLGFVTALAMEVVTGKGALGQLGLDPVAVRYPFLFGLAFLLFGGLLGGYVVINNPPDFSKAPPNAGEGVPRNPFDSLEEDRLPTYTRGGVVDLPSGQKGREPYVSDLTDSKK